MPRPRSLGSASEISPQTREEYDQALLLTPSEKAEAEAKHLFHGLPISPPGADNERLVHQRDYIVLYDDDLRVPIWTMHHMLPVDAETDRTRIDCFREDMRLPEDAAGFCDDYKNSGFDRGHMVASGDRKATEESMINTFILTKMTPQPPNLNR